MKLSKTQNNDISRYKSLQQDDRREKIQKDENLEAERERWRSQHQNRRIRRIRKGANRKEKKD